MKESFKDVGQRFDFHLIRSVGCMVNGYDFTYQEESKCEVKARNAVRVYEIEEGAITDLINNNFEFKQLWFKSLFVYCYRLHDGLRAIMGEDLSESQVRRLVERSEVVCLGTNQTYSVEVGAFVFMGQIES